MNTTATVPTKATKKREPHIRRGVRIHIGLKDSEADRCREAADGLFPSDGHVCFGINGKPYEIFYLLDGKTPTLFKAFLPNDIVPATGARTAGASMIITGSANIREAIKRMVNRTPSACGIALKRDPSESADAIDVTPAATPPASIAQGEPTVPATKTKTKKKSTTKAAASKPRAKKADGEKRISGLDEAVAVLKNASGPLHYAEITTRVLKRGNWKPKGKTPAATLRSAMYRDPARFVQLKNGNFRLKD